MTLEVVLVTTGGTLYMRKGKRPCEYFFAPLDDAPKRNTAYPVVTCNLSIERDGCVSLDYLHIDTTEGVPLR